MINIDNIESSALGFDEYLPNDGESSVVTIHRDFFEFLTESLSDAYDQIERDTDMKETLLHIIDDLLEEIYLLDCSLNPEASE